ncbi:MAG: hypothetical protein NTV56_07205 [Alphaproteobacteria bacterium]|nr:hypothetical protein [Alphaproteobacteria bacterium]
MDEQQKPRLPERAIDAIPEDGVLLRNAYLWFCWQFDDIPNGDVLLANIAGKDVIERSMRLRQSQDPEAFKTESSLWRTDAAAHMLLRDALSCDKLHAYIRDPDAGVTLKIGREGWLPIWWQSNKGSSGKRVGVFSNFRALGACM